MRRSSQGPGWRVRLSAALTRCVGEDEPRLADRFDRQPHLRARRTCRASRMPIVARRFTPSRMPRKRLRPSTGSLHLDLRLVPGPDLEILGAGQRPVDAGRRNLQMIFPVDRIGDVHRRRDIARKHLAILHRHRAVRPLGHDLHGHAVQARDLHAHQARSRDRWRSAPRYGRCGLQARSHASDGGRPFNPSPGSRAQGPSGNKKERAPRDPPSIWIRDVLCADIGPRPASCKRGIRQQNHGTNLWNGRLC